MDPKVLKEILAEHADQLVNGRAAREDFLNRLPEEGEDLAPLFDVAESLQSTLTPITPANRFEEELKRELLSTAQRLQAQGYKPPHPFRELFLVLASLAFILSLATVFVALRFRAEQSQG